MLTVDLPAGGLTTVGSGVTIVGGPDALTTVDTATYVRMTSDQGYLLQMHNGGDPGFGYANLSGVHVFDISIVAYAYRETGVAYDPAWLDAGEEPAATAPTINYTYQGSPYDSGNNIELPLGDYGWVSKPLPQSQWFRLLDATLPPGEERLSPAFIAGPAQGWNYAPGHWVRIAYLGARITYGDAPQQRAAHQRVVQRGSDGLGFTGGRRVVGAKTVQASNRRGAAIR